MRLRSFLAGSTVAEVVEEVEGAMVAAAMAFTRGAVLGGHS